MAMRDPYRSSAGDLGFGGRGAERWDAERFSMERERDRTRFGGERDRERFQERDSHFSRGGPPPRARERSVDEIYERRERGGIRGGYEDDRIREKVYYEEEPRFARRPRGETVTIEKEREYYSPSPPRRNLPRPGGLLRRQSSLDTFDRKPFPRFSEEERYGPPARIPREDYRPPPLTPIPLPRSRQLPPPRRYEREYEDIKIAEPDYYGDDDFRGFPERIREREIIRTRRRSKSKESHGHSHSHSHASRSVRGSVRSSSSSSSSSAAETVRSEFPKRGKTRMPRRLVSKKAIIELGYPFEDEGDVIIIQKALGPDNIDEVIKLSEIYKQEKRYHMHGGRSEAGTVIEERREEIFEVPVAPQVPQVIPPPPMETVHQTTTQTVERGHSHSHSRSRAPSPARSHMSHHHGAPLIIHADRPEEVYERREEYIERSDALPMGALALAPQHAMRDERSIRAEIKALEAEKEALRAERKADRELRRADRIRREGRESGELMLYEERVERVREPEGGVRIEKDKKGSNPRAIRAMLATLT